MSWEANYFIEKDSEFRWSYIGIYLFIYQYINRWCNVKMRIKELNSINYGKLIASKRIQNNITQEELARGICSIPYLSKIENEKIEPNSEIIELICKKLNLSYVQLEEENTEIASIIERLYVAINDNEGILVDSLWTLLIKFEGRIYNPDITIYYHLICLRYFLYSKDLESARNLSNKLKMIIKTFDNDQLFYYYYFTGLLCLNEQDYFEGINFFTIALSYQEHMTVKDYHIIYYLSLSYSHMKNTSLAIQYGTIALEYFQKNMHYNRFIECQMIIGINYVRNKQYKIALDSYEQILKLAKKARDKKNIARTYHNIGYLFSMQNEHSNAIKYYENSLKYKIESDPMYVNTVYYISKEYIRVQNKTLAFNWLKKGLNSTATKESKILSIKLNVLKYAISEEVEEYIRYLENEATPYLKSINDFPSLIEFYELLGDLYNKKQLYKKSCNFYKQALKLLERN